jgi:MOSC domain
MWLHARYLEEPEPGAHPPAIEVTSPDGRCVRSDDGDVDERLSELLGHPVALCPLRPATDAEHYRRGAPDDDDVETELRAIFGRELDEPLPTFQGIPLDVLVDYESPPGTYFDAFPIHLVTDRSLATLASLAPGTAFDVRRFRPNLVVGVEGHVVGEFPEQSWLGRRIRVGDVELDATAPCPRCVMVTRAFRRPLRGSSRAAHDRPPRRPERRCVRQRRPSRSVRGGRGGHAGLTDRRAPDAAPLRSPGVVPQVPPRWRLTRTDGGCRGRAGRRVAGSLTPPRSRGRCRSSRGFPRGPGR